MLKKEFDLKAKIVLDSIEQLKKDFVQLITNKEISLDERWNVFLNTPLCIKNEYSFFSSLPKELKQCFEPGIMEEIEDSIDESIILPISELLKLQEDNTMEDTIKEIILKYNIGFFHV